MKKMQIFEPAMCCPTGLCGVSIDPELLRISTVLNSLEKNGVKVERFNLTDAPMEFVNNKKVNDFIFANGVEKLPVVTLNEEIIIVGRYPTNEELVKILEIPESYLSQGKGTKIEDTSKNSGGCCSGDNSCC